MDTLWKISRPPGVEAAVPPGPLDLSPHCTMGVVGTDNLSNKIAVSARHCVEAVHYINDGDPVYRYTPTGAGVC
ncbi:hypothetical protein BDB13_6028 [Rhodococcus sp. OK302]|nr:hypothetical protein BDB13_6028 [Rhodococcus sp. OK302]